ncbi:MAG: ankyrin repeat domain-containing protein [Gemmatimonadota bacterium]|nr:ankyrin repeat domain-containing protein [Gemmatimonadota bacterium]
MTSIDEGAVLRAAGDGELEALRRLLERDRELANVVGANPYWGGRVQPLHLAVTWTQEEAVRILLAAGADASGDNAGYGGWSPLMLAATRGLESIVGLLVDAGARVGLFEAAALGRARTVAEILAGNPDRAKHVLPDGTTPLHLAATREIADLLLEAGAVPTLRDGYGGAPLDAAIARAARGCGDSEAVARRLIAAGAEVDAATYAALGDLEALDAELDRYPDALHELSARGAAPLHAAAARGRLNAVRHLLKRGADPDQRDGEGIRPLHWVTRAPRDDTAIARALLDAGADPLARDDEHDATPAGWAAFQRRPTLEQLLREAEERARDL